MLSSFFYNAAGMALMTFTATFILGYSSPPWMEFPLLYVFGVCAVIFMLGTVAAVLCQIRGK